jgi:hypothetical protein
MSAVFEFDDLPSISISKDEAIAEATESGYSSENDTTEASIKALDEKLYEVSLNENYISSSVTNTTPSHSGKVCLEDFEILKLLGRGA